LHAVADLAEARSSAAFALEVGKQLAVSGHQAAGALDDESNFIIAVILADEEDDAGERR
jgi:hypothetical protein